MYFCQQNCNQWLVKLTGQLLGTAWTANGQWHYSCLAVGNDKKVLAFINQFYFIMTRLVWLSLANDYFRNHFAISSKYFDMVCHLK